MYEAPVSKILVGLADAANSSSATTTTTTEDDPFGGQTFIGDCL